MRDCCYGNSILNLWETQYCFLNGSTMYIFTKSFGVFFFFMYFLSSNSHCNTYLAISHYISSYISIRHLYDFWNNTLNTLHIWKLVYMCAYDVKLCGFFGYFGDSPLSRYKICKYYICYTDCLTIVDHFLFCTDPITTEAIYTSFLLLLLLSFWIHGKYIATYLRYSLWSL